MGFDEESRKHKEVRDLRIVGHARPGLLGPDGVLCLDLPSYSGVEINSETETVTLTECRE
jgi:hypothetical protein